MAIYFGSTRSKLISSGLGAGGEACSGMHVIEVSELPTENIKDNALYLCDGKYYKHTSGFTDLILVADGEIQSCERLGAEAGMIVTFQKLTPNTLEELENIEFLESDLLTTCHFYYINFSNLNDETLTNDVYIYNSAQMFTVSQILYIPYGGEISDISEATTDGYYVMSDAWEKYSYVTGTLQIAENGTYDVTEYENVNVDIPNKVVIGKWELASYIDFPPGLVTVMVNFSSEFNGELINYVAIEFYWGDSQFWYVREDGSMDLPYDLSNWAWNASRIIDFGSTPQIVTEKFYSAFFLGAKPMYKIVDIETITFTIDGTTYFAESGSTWQEWVVSDFNTGGYVIDSTDNTVWYGTTCAVLYQGDPIAATDTITDGTAYDHNNG